MHAQGHLSPARRALVRQAFNKLDADGDGRVSVEEIARLYDASRHPEVLAGRKTRHQVYREFLDTFDCGEKVRIVTGLCPSVRALPHLPDACVVQDGIVTLPEFERYYGNVSASIDADAYFEAVMTRSWNLSAANVAAADARAAVASPVGARQAWAEPVGGSPAAGAKTLQSSGALPRAIVSSSLLGLTLWRWRDRGCHCCHCRHLRVAAAPAALLRPARVAHALALCAGQSPRRRRASAGATLPRRNEPLRL